MTARLIGGVLLCLGMAFPTPAQETVDEMIAHKRVWEAGWSDAWRLKSKQMLEWSGRDSLLFGPIYHVEWERSDAPAAVDVPKATLERWSTEREAFALAYLRWKRVAEEIEETLYRAEERRVENKPAVVQVAAAVAARAPRRRAT